MIRLKNVGRNIDELEADDYVFFFSYGVPVAFYDRMERVKYETTEFWSVTTQKHIDRWAGLREGEVRKISQQQLEKFLGGETEAPCDFPAVEEKTK